MPRIEHEKFYTAAYIKHGIDAKGLNWNSKLSQEKRFDQILAALPKSLDDYTLADAGCGFGDLYPYILQKGLSPKEYIGIEFLEESCKIARMQSGCEILCADICRDPLPTADYYLCSGALNTLTPFETQLFIRRCFEASTKGFIFNILFGHNDSPNYNYFDKTDIDHLACEYSGATIKTSLGYLEDDITVAMMKETK